MLKSKGQIHQKFLRLMGNSFALTVVEENAEIAEEHIDAAIDEIKRIEALLTTFSENSQTNLVNQQAGTSPVRVDKEVFQLVQRSIRISELTQGSFDISYGSIDKSLWNFDLSMKALPDKATAKASVRLINYKNILLNEADSSIFLKEKGMRIGFGGIGKGYAAEMAKSLLIKRGIKAGVVNAAGDLTTWGKQPDGKEWTVGIADPTIRDRSFSSICISNMAIATSGNYEKYVVIGGKKYSHTIDPKTGFPVTGIKSATIICPNAELADAMATPIMVMGVAVGLDLVNQLPNMACIIVDDANKVHTTRNIRIR
ncbi:MAG: FAD:protein FMN transferase [Flectobacillus sp.]|nr:FAD:protein FMN transferase [Flectobacillus sp.]